jgi:hypothetical protein
MVNQLAERSYFTVNIGTCEQITATFDKNFGIGLPDISGDSRLALAAKELDLIHIFC